MLARRPVAVLVAALAALVPGSAQAGPHLAAEEEAEAGAERPLTSLSLEELATIEVTSVSKRAEPRFAAAAAIHVITSDDIRRAGAHTIADALRLAPGVHVARINANQWAVGVRGFASRLSRSLLALIDGRSVYTPLFAGVYWEVQDSFLDDVDRIEVIRGPGGTLWGANAVNGVVNMITKPASATPGFEGRLRTGTVSPIVASARYGGSAGERGAWRVWAKYFDRDPLRRPPGTDGREFDGWQAGSGGFRADWDLTGGSALTVQGDAYAHEAGQRTTITSLEAPFTRQVERDADLTGANLLARWGGRVGNHGALTVQGYYDHTRRVEASFAETRDTVDLDLQHRFTPSGRQDLVVGLGTRVSRGETTGVPSVRFDPATRTDALVSGFVHDELQLVTDRLRLTLGSKFEHNDYSGFEVQPSAALTWTPAPTHALWTSLSRAVRTPSPVDEDLALVASLSPDTPFFARLEGNKRFHAEEVVAGQVGYRVRPTPRLTLDGVAFYHDYDRLFSLEPGGLESEDGRTFLPFRIGNGIYGRSRGVEATCEVQVVTAWRLAASWSTLDLDLGTKRGSADTTQQAAERSAPRHQGSLRSRLDAHGGLKLDAILRWVGELEATAVPRYVTLDARIAWAPRYRWELALIGHNLLQPHHVEFSGTSPDRTEVERAVLGEAIVRW